METQPPTYTGEASLGVFRLAYGVTLIVVAYKDSSSIDVVVHGTIIDGEKWAELVARPLVASSSTPLLPLTMRIKDELRSGWVLCRILLQANGSQSYGHGCVCSVRRVYVLLEIPVYYLNSTILYGLNYSTKILRLPCSEPRTSG
jgi:hypothetical protein